MCDFFTLYESDVKIALKLLLWDEKLLLKYLKTKCVNIRFVMCDASVNGREDR